MSKKLTTTEFITRCVAVHGDRYVYSKTKYKDVFTPVIITCKTHGDFTQNPRSHERGNGCVLCSGLKRKTTDSFIADAQKLHGDKYDYSQVKYVNNKTPVVIKCDVHGEFKQTPNMHLRGQGCRECGYEHISQSLFSNKEDFVTNANKIHNNKYTYENVVYAHSKSAVTITCPEHGDFNQLPNGHLMGQGCPRCVMHVSKAEDAVAEFIEANYSGIILRNNDTNKILPSGRHFDIYLPELKLAVEYCGLTFHGSNPYFMKKDYKTYHLKKFQECETLGIKLIQIFENEWILKQEIVKSRLLSALGKNRIIGARQLLVKWVSNSDAKKFFIKSHLQGNYRTNDCLGLYEGDTIVMAMSFGKSRYNKHYQWEILRLASLPFVNVVGGASRLFKEFVRLYKPISVVTYADLRWGTGKSYESMGFEFNHRSVPNYFYFKGYNLESRVKFQKHKLADKLEVFDASNTEKENMTANGYHHIYDCGNAVYVWKA